MKLHTFLSKHIDDVIAEWDRFARSQRPAADEMSGLALRDHAREILVAITLDIDTDQNMAEQMEKSQGQVDGNGETKSAAAIHGALRQASNFSLLQLSAEYRALRATVLRLWLPHVTVSDVGAMYEMVRFNEAIDQALAESIVTFSERADTTRELFLAILGHDLRAPLSTVSLLGTLISQPKASRTQINDAGARLIRSARLMGSMVNDLIEYTRAEMGGGMPITLQETDLTEVLFASIEDAVSRHPDMHFEVESSGDCIGLFDSVRLHQLYTNLLLNAAQYGARAKKVRVLAWRDGDQIAVSITNFGPIIRPESMGLIFLPLTQLDLHSTEPTRARSSLGLGLFVAREIALAHGGSIAVESTQADGTIFTVRLPLTGVVPTPALPR